MGERANLILIDNFDYEIYYNHWCAIIIPEIVFFGPQITKEFIQRQAISTKYEGWLDMVWAEGGILLDCIERRLLFFGGELLCYDIPLREVYLEVLQYSWEGWDIKWAYSGICDLAMYVNFPLDNLLKNNKDTNEKSDVEICVNNNDGLILCTYIENRKTQTLLLDGIFEDYLFSGTSFMKNLKQVLNNDDAHLSIWPKEFPTDGIVIDLDSNRLSFWSSDTHYNLEYDLACTWDSWYIEN